jgi:transcriptional regulator GlxA family with amidase domain
MAGLAGCKTMRFGIFIYDGVEPIDLATYGVLSMAKRVVDDIAICTIAPRAGVVALSNGLRVVADHGIADAPHCDLLVVTGGPGWVAQAGDAATLAFLRQRAADATTMASVCTGAMILAAAGLLDGRQATTKREVRQPEASPLDVMRDRYPAIAPVAATLVDAGTVITGGGVSLCIDTMLHLLERHYGPQVARETARIIEYSRARAANQRELPAIIAAAAA